MGDRGIAGEGHGGRTMGDRGIAGEDHVGSGASVGGTFPGEELWISVSSTSNVDTLSLRPCHLVGYFNNAKWILQASQFERQARQLGVPQPRVTASASAAVCGLYIATDTSSKCQGIQQLYL